MPAKNPAMQFTRAVRTAMPLCCGLFGEGGSGKTYSSLLLARGLVGPEGKIALIDTEYEKSRLFAKLTPFDLIALEAPYKPEIFTEAIHGAVEQGYDIVIVDSLSAEWSGEGGVLDRADDQKYGGGKDMQGLSKWKIPKAEHKDLLHALQAHPIHVICTLRAREINRQVKDPKTGKDIVVREGLGPETEKYTHHIFDFYGLLDDQHRFIMRKDRTCQFPKTPFVITEKTGKMLRDFFDSGEEVKGRGKGGKVFEDKSIAAVLTELGLDKSQHDAVIRKNLGGLDPDSDEAIDKVMRMASSKLDERDAKKDGEK